MRLQAATGFLPEFHDARSASGTQRLEFLCAVAVAFLAPMNFLRLPQIYLTASDLFCVAFLVLVFVNRSATGSRLARLRFGPASMLWAVGVAMLVSSLLFSSVVNGDAARGAIVSAQYLFAYLALPLVFVTRTRAELMVMTKAFLVSIALMCLFGVWLIHVDGETNTRFVTGNGRMRSFVERTNEAAALISLSMPLLLLMGRWRQWSTPTILLMLALCGYGVLLTGSNTGLMGFAFALAVFVALARSWRLLLGGILLGTVSALVVMRLGEAYLPTVFVERVLRALVSGDLSQAGTYSDRVDLIRLSLVRANETVLLGVGADRFPVGTGLRQTVHNAYLLLWVEGGPASVGGLVLAIIAGVTVGWRRFREAVRMPAGRFDRASTARGRAAKADMMALGACTLTTVLVFALVVNAVPHIYGRFWVVPLLLAISLAEPVPGLARPDLKRWRR